MTVVDYNALSDYLEFAWRDREAESYKESAEVFRRFFSNNPAFVDRITYSAMHALSKVEGEDPVGILQGAVLTVWVASFQMGREYEQRLRDQAELDRIKDAK